MTRGGGGLGGGRSRRRLWALAARLRGLGAVVGGGVLFRGDRRLAVARKLILCPWPVWSLLRLWAGAGRDIAGHCPGGVARVFDMCCTAVGVVLRYVPLRTVTCCYALQLQLPLQLAL
jgi:hypothetical protein